MQWFFGFFNLVQFQVFVIFQNFSLVCLFVFVFVFCFFGGFFCNIMSFSITWRKDHFRFSWSTYNKISWEWHILDILAFNLLFGNSPMVLVVFLFCLCRILCSQQIKFVDLHNVGFPIFKSMWSPLIRRLAVLHLRLLHLLTIFFSLNINWTLITGILKFGTWCLLYYYYYYNYYYYYYSPCG